MKLKIMAYIFAFLALTTFSYAQSDYIIEVDQNNKATIKAYTGEEQKLKLPNVIDGVEVVGIADRAFYQNTNIVSVSLPDTINSIGEESFAQCPNLSTMYINANVEYIGDDAFKDSDNLVALVDEKSYAYNYCLTNDMQFQFVYKTDALASVVVPNNKSKIEEEQITQAVEPLKTESQTATLETVLTPTPVLTANPVETAVPTPVLTSTPVVTTAPTPVLTATPVETQVPTPTVTSEPTKTQEPTPVVTEQPNSDSPQESPTPEKQNSDEPSPSDEASEEPVSTDQIN